MIGFSFCLLYSCVTMKVKVSAACFYLVACIFLKKCFLVIVRDGVVTEIVYSI